MLRPGQDFRKAAPKARSNVLISETRQKENKRVGTSSDGAEDPRDEIVEIRPEGLRVRARAKADDHEVSRWNYHRRLAHESRGPKRVPGNEIEATTPIEPEEAPVTLVRIPGRGRRDELHPALGKNPLSLPDAVPEQR